MYPEDDEDGLTIAHKPMRMSPRSVSAVILQGSLKPDADKSHTQALAEMVAGKLEDRGVEVEILPLSQLALRAGISEKMGDTGGKQVFEAIRAADIVIFATPIWWNQPSSHIQKVLERMSAFDDQYIESNRSELYGKVAGVIVTGAEDGFQSCMARLMCFASQLGFTVPPEAFATWAGDPAKTVTKDQKTMEMVKTMARNLAAWAKLLKASEIGEEVQQSEEGTDKQGYLAS